MIENEVFYRLKAEELARLADEQRKTIEALRLWIAEHT